ncbi:MAG: hypothetical protein ACRDQG_07635 [Pseudonocardiaceae bacterium]
MSEVDETSARIRQLTMTLLSGALAAAQAAQLLRARKAREAAKAAATEQAQLRRQLQADRATAAVLWKRALDPRLASTNPEQLAQGWASAVAWETLDVRAAGTARRLDERLRAAGVHPETVRAARETDDYAALALLLARAEEPTVVAGQAPGEERHDKEIEDLFDRDAGELIDTVAVIEGALDPDTAGEVLAAEALPALEAELQRAAGRGHDPGVLLSQVAAQRSLGDAVDPAAVLHYRLARHLHLEPVTNPAEPGEDAWWLLDEAALDRTGAAHDRADADAQRWAEDAAAGVAADPSQDRVTRTAAETAAGERAGEAGHLERDATALTAEAADATAAAASAAPSPPQVEPELGFTGGSETARLAAESYPHSLRTGLARNPNPRRTPKARGRRAGQHTEQDRGR